MKVLLDEDVPLQLLGLLRDLLPSHEWDHINELGWKRKGDVSLMRDAGKRGYEVLITKNVGQLHEPAERRAATKAGLHHVIYPDVANRTDRTGSARAIGSTIAAMPLLIQALGEADGLQIARIQVIDPGRRFVLTPKGRERS